MSGESILMIEDDLNVFHGIQRKLKALNYNVFYAPDAIASISQARQHHPDLILLDLGLPAGDGFVVMERLKQFPELCLTPVIVLSGRDRLGNEIRALRAGAAAFLQKPVNSDLLLETIRKYLAKKEPVARPQATYSVGMNSVEEPAGKADVFAYSR